MWGARGPGPGGPALNPPLGQRGRNVTIMMFISPMHGLIYHTGQIGGMNDVQFNDSVPGTNKNTDG